MILQRRHQSMPVKPTYPHSSISLVPESCQNSLEPCSTPKPGCYTQYINHSFKLVIDDLLRTGTTKARFAALVQETEEYNIWKIHWQRGLVCHRGPGHCITVFQYKNSPQPYEGHEDYTSNSVFSIPGGCLALGTSTLSTPLSQSSDTTTRQLLSQ